MPRPTTRLSNCYVPQQFDDEPSPVGGVRADGRESHSLRQLVMQQSPSKDSCLVELGHTKVLCHVRAPLTANSPLLPSSVNLDMDTGTLHVEVKYASPTAYPTSTLLASTVQNVDQTQQQSTGKTNSWIMTRETELSGRLHAALAAAVCLEPFAKTCVLIQLTVLQDDGSVLPACILASTVSLCLARVFLADTVTACRVAVRSDGSLWADPTLAEESLSSTSRYGDDKDNGTTTTKAIVTLGLLPNSKQVTLWEQCGQALSAQETNAAMDLCRDGCRTMQRFVREYLIASCEKTEHDDGDDK